MALNVLLLLLVNIIYITDGTDHVLLRREQSRRNHIGNKYNDGSGFKQKQSTKKNRNYANKLMDPGSSKVINDEIYNERKRQSPFVDLKGDDMIHIEDFHDAHHDHFAMKDDASDSLDDDDEDQTYSDKKQSVAFLLTLFLGEAGGGRWYVGSYGLASLKLILFIFILIGPCILACCCIPTVFAEGTNNSGLALCGGVYGCLGICLLFACFVGLCAFQIADIILFAINDIPDEDGLTLKPW